jgi:hypothetical protein
MAAPTHALTELHTARDVPPQTRHPSSPLTFLALYLGLVMCAVVPKIVAKNVS